MNDVPLIKTNSINDINTSLIAIKKQLKQINEAVGLIDIPSVDTSSFVKKSDVVDTVESGNLNPVTSNAVANSNAMPVDEVTVDNMHSVTSNAVAVALAKRHYYHTVFSGEYTDGWHTRTINFDKVFKYPPLVSVTVSQNNIGDQYPTYWQTTDTPFFIVTTEYVRIAYYVRDSAQYNYDVNVIGELP